MLLMYICDKCMINVYLAEKRTKPSSIPADVNVLSICHTVNVFLWKIKHETLKPWNFQLTKLITEHRFAQRSLKCETLKNWDFVAEITPSRSMIEFHLHSFALSNWNGAWKRLFADTKLFEHGVGSIHKTLGISISNSKKKCLKKYSSHSFWAKNKQILFTNIFGFFWELLNLNKNTKFYNFQWRIPF